MKTRTLYLIFAALCVALLLTGCNSRSSDGKHPEKVSIIQKALDATLPKSTTGYVLGVHDNQYFTISFEGDGLKHTPEGWTWTWIEYDRKSNIPIFTGFNWASTGKVRLGKRP